MAAAASSSSEGFVGAPAALPLDKVGADLLRIGPICSLGALI